MYLQIDEGFVGHPKTRAFCGKLQEPNAAMYLIKLWTWAVRSAPNGDLSEMNPWSIEDVVGYRNADGKCYSAMVACGFVDELETGAPKCIHNWAKRTGGDIVKMENEAERKRLLRMHKANPPRCNPETCPFHRRSEDVSAEYDGPSTGHPSDTAETAPGHRKDDLDQDKSSQGQSSQDQQTEPPRVHAGSTNGAKVWNAHDWRDRYGRAWVAKYQTIAYGDAGDTKGCVALGDVLDKLPEAERLAAQAKAPEMFAEFLGNIDQRVVGRRHPFVFFVQEWGGLRVPKKAIPVDTRCGFHRVYGTRGKKPRDGWSAECPECREGRAAAGTRTGDPSSLASVAATDRKVEELRKAAERRASPEQLAQAREEFENEQRQKAAAAT